MRAGVEKSKLKEWKWNIGPLKQAIILTELLDARAICVLLFTNQSCILTWEKWLNELHLCEFQWTEISKVGASSVFISYDTVSCPLNQGFPYKF